MQIDLTALLCAIVAVIGAILTKVLVPYINSKTTLAQRQTAQALIAAAVTAAEQMPSLKGADGAKKKDYVFDWLKKRGLRIDPDELDAQVEAAVYALKHGLGV